LQEKMFKLSNLAIEIKHGDLAKQKQTRFVTPRTACSTWAGEPQGC